MARILVVDDEEQVATAIRRLLGRGGHEIIVALSGEEAVEQMELTPPDAVVADLSMPGLNGLRVLDIARERYPRSRRVLVSARWDVAPAFDSPEGRALCQFVPKPWDQSELLDALGLSPFAMTGS